MTRRGFFGRLLVAPAVTLLPKAVKHPVIHGDGYHDDGPGLDAWGAGKPVVDRHGFSIGDWLEGMRVWRRVPHHDGSWLNITRKGPIAVVNNWFDCA